MDLNGSKRLQQNQPQNHDVLRQVCGGLSLYIYFLCVRLNDALMSYPLLSFESMCMQLLTFLFLSFLFLFTFPMSSLVLEQSLYLGSPAKLLSGFSSFPEAQR